MIVNIWNHIYIYYTAKCPNVPISNLHRYSVAFSTVNLWFSRICRIPSFHDFRGLSRVLFPDSVHLNSLWGSLSCSILIRWSNHSNSFISILSSIIYCALALSLSLSLITWFLTFFHLVIPSDHHISIFETLSLFFISIFMILTIITQHKF